MTKKSKIIFLILVIVASVLFFFPKMCPGSGGGVFYDNQGNAKGTYSARGCNEECIGINYGFLCFGVVISTKIN